MKHLFLFIGLLLIAIIAFAQSDVVQHKVKSKETLYSISKDYGVTVNDLMKANTGLDANIREGQIISIPKIENETDFVTFHVTTITNLKKVASLYNVPVSLLEKENPGLDYKLYPGQKVKIPVGSKTFVAKQEVEVAEDLVEEPESEIVLINSSCDTKNPNTKKTFKIALMIPFYLGQADSIQKELFLKTENDDFAPFRFLAFYEGALMAVDSLKKQGMNVKLFVYDVDDNTAKTSNVLQNPELKEMNLIIGPFLNKSFDQVAKFAGMYNIPIVNPLSFRDEITVKYNSVIKVKPKNIYQNQLLADLIKRDFPYARVYLIKQSGYKDAGELQALQQLLESSVPQIHKISNRDIYNWAVSISNNRKINYLPTLKLEGVSINPASLESKLSDSTIFENKLVAVNYSSDSLRYFLKTAPNLRNSLVIIYGDSKAFVMDVMNRLNEVRDTFNIRIIGMPGWERMSNLDYNQCNDMNLIYFSSSFVDYDLPKVERFNYYFRQKYDTEPGEYAFNGFDVTYFFLFALFHFDKNFSDCIQNLEMNIFQSTYLFNRVGDTRNFENTHWNILEYDRFRLKKLPTP